MKPMVAFMHDATSMTNILIIDDDRDLCSLLMEYFGLEGLTAQAVNEPIAGITQAASGGYDLVVLDVMLPELDGFETLRRIRAASRVPVLMLTACGGDTDRIAGLENGADDYLQKPFNPRELLARIRAILRRTAPVAESGADRRRSIVSGDLELVLGSRTACLAGRALGLTSAEFSILAMLLDKPGEPVGREDLTRTVLGRELTATDRSIDVHVSNLRRKLGPGSNGIERIKSLRSLGYLYVVG